jgi:hypothetical protein
MMQTSNGYPLDLNDRQQGVDRRPPAHPEAYQDRMERLEASGLNEAHAAKCQAAAERAAALRFRRGVRSEAGFPCPEPRIIEATPSHDVTSPASANAGYQAGMIHGYRFGTDRSWAGMTTWGAAYQAGIEYGRSFRIS